MTRVVDSIFAEDAEQMQEVGDTAPITKLAREMVQLEQNIEDYENAITQAKARKNEIAHRLLPELFDAANTDRVGLPDSNADLVLRPWYHANIAADWEPERKEKAFGWLEENGHGDIVRVGVVVEYSRGELDKARLLEKHIADFFTRSNEPPKKIQMNMHVPWNTLTAFVREQTESGNVVDLEVLGAQVGRVAKIEKRKKK